MVIKTHRNFDKQFAKLSQKQLKKAEASLILFMKNPHAAKLRRHALNGEYSGHYFISAGGDLRLHFRYLSSDAVMVIFTAVDSHAQLYK